MADYSLVINSQFKPFSYQEMLAPVLMATQAHQELENQYGELSAKANIWEEMANEQTDPYAYKMYKAYANDLEEKARQLANEGLNASSRRNMLNMRARYSKEISPIEAAYKRREELAAEQRKMSLTNPTMFYQRNASTMSLDDFIKNPSIDYGESYSGELLRQQVGQMAANLKTALVGKGKLKGVGLPYQYEQLLQYGYTPQQIQQAITNPQKGNPVLNTMVEQALQASGMSKWASLDQLKRARGYANEGLYNAIGRTEFKNYTDNFSMQDELDRRREEREAIKAAKKTEDHDKELLNLRHWEGTIDTKDKNNSIYKTINAITNTKYGHGHGLGVDYGGKNEFHNPLMIYEEYIAYKKTHPDEVPKLTSNGAYVPVPDPSLYKSPAADYIKKKYGVTNILSGTDYNNLKALGLTSKSGFTAFAGNSLQQRYNRLATISRPTSINTASTDYIGSTMASSIKIDDKSDGKLYTYGSDGRKGKAVKYSDIFDNENKDILDIAYSYKEPDKVAIKTGKGKFYVSPYYFSAELGNIVNDAKTAITDPATTIEEKGQIQDAVGAQIEALSNSYNKNRSKTSNER